MFLSGSSTKAKQSVGVTSCGREHAIQLLDALNAPERDPWTLVDAGWTSNQRPAVNAGNGNGS